MRPEWPEDAAFHRLILDVESEHCELCGQVLHVCDHRFHRFHTLQGPLELLCRLAHCSDRACPARKETLSPAAELSLILPWWLIGWDVFCWLGHRRFARHWSVPQLQEELHEAYHIKLCRDTVVNYLHRYQNLVAARQQDPQQLAFAYRRIKSLVLTIDGLQPEKGHETLYVVREINAKRVWFAEALLSSNQDGVRRRGRRGKSVPRATRAADLASAGDAGSVQETEASNDTAARVVLDYCAAVRGILNDDQGGPLHPPGLRMAEALTEVHESLERNLALNKPGPAHGQLQRLAACIDSGLGSVKAEQEEVRQQVEEIAKVAATLQEDQGSRQERRARYKNLQKEYEGKGGEFYGHLGRLMLSWLAGLFLGPRARKGEKGLQDNLELERWFRKPKRHERQIHGRRHAGVRIVQEGPTLVLVLDAHDGRPRPFTAEELLPYWPAEEPLEQQEALQRRKVMRLAQSKKKRNTLLKELESRYRA